MTATQQKPSTGSSSPPLACRSGGGGVDDLVASVRRRHEQANTRIVDVGARRRTSPLIGRTCHECAYHDHDDMPQPVATTAAMPASTTATMAAASARSISWGGPVRATRNWNPRCQRCSSAAPTGSCAPSTPTRPVSPFGTNTTAQPPVAQSAPAPGSTCARSARADYACVFGLCLLSGGQLTSTNTPTPRELSKSAC